MLWRSPPTQPKTSRTDRVSTSCSSAQAAPPRPLLALKMLAPGGILVVVGAGPDPGLDSATILLKEITVRGSYIYTDEFDRAIQLLAAQQVAVADLTTVISPLPDALTAFDALARRPNHESAHLRRPPSRNRDRLGVLCGAPNQSSSCHGASPMTSANVSDRFATIRSDSQSSWRGS